MLTNLMNFLLRKPSKESANKNSSFGGQSTYST